MLTVPKRERKAWAVVIGLSLVPTIFLFLWAFFGET